MLYFLVSYEVGEPSNGDKSLFFDRLIEAALSVLLDGVTEKSHDSASLPELPRAPKVASGPKASELKAKLEAEQHALRRLRMCLRDICNRSDFPFLHLVHSIKIGYFLIDTTTCLDFFHDLHFLRL